MQNLSTSLFSCISVCLLTLTGCGESQGVNSQDRQERQSLAFDVASKYVEDAAAGVPNVLTISNETSVHDIVGSFELRAGFNAVDRTALQTAIRRDDPSLADADVQGIIGHLEANLTTIKLGDGATFSERGGENICLDHSGDIAEIALRKSLGEVTHTANGSYTLTVSFFLTAHKGSPRLSYETTEFTDSYGKSDSGTKGLLLSLTRAGSDNVTHEVTHEQPLHIGALVKY